MKGIIKLVLVVAFVLGLDQVSKYLVRLKMILGQSMDVAGNIFALTYVENPGAAFGILAQKTIFFVLLTVVVVAFICYIYFKVNDKNKLTGFALAVVVGGAIGNLIDRVYKGTVTDMFDFHFWPVFNVADVALVLGLGYVAYRLIFHGEEF